MFLRRASSSACSAGKRNFGAQAGGPASARKESGAHRLRWLIWYCLLLVLSGDDNARCGGASSCCSANTAPTVVARRYLSVASLAKVGPPAGSVPSAPPDPWPR